MVGAGCGISGRCYQISCLDCDPQPKRYPNHQPQPVQPTAGARRVRSRYIGQSGTSLHLRMRSHRSNKQGVIHKHIQEYHQEQDSSPPEFGMWPVKSTRTIMERLGWESSLISKEDKERSGILMNSKSEYGRGKLIRFEPQIIRT